MKETKIGTALYGFREKKVELIEKGIGTCAIAGLYTSIYRSGESSSAKISTAALLFDLIIKYPGSIAVYEDKINSQIYCEILGTKCICNADTIYYESESDFLSNKTPWYLPIPYLLYDMASFSANSEIRDLVKALLSGITKHPSVSAAPITSYIWNICDSFYYEYAKKIGVFKEDTGLMASTVEAAFRSGTFEQIDIFASYDKYFAKSEYATSKPKPTRKKKNVDFLQECKDGKYRLAYTWPVEMQRFIISPSYLDSFESTEIFEEIVKKIKFHADKIIERMDMGFTGADAIGEDALNILMIGKPGTGKTTLAYALSAATGVPVCSTVWNKHSDEDEVEGKTKIVDGKPTFVETNALIFHLNGGINVNEEINLADPSVTMGSLGQQLEYPYIVKKNGYEVTVRHPLNVQIATMNVGTNGSNPLNQALANRFKTTFILDDPTKDTFINILIKATKKDKSICEWVYGIYDKVVSYLKSPEVNEDEIVQNLSIRTCIGAITNMEEGQSPVRALINSIVGAVASVDLEVARRLQHDVIDIIPVPTFEF